MNNNSITFTVTCTMKERWVPHFLSMLKAMENNGIAGRSRNVGIYSDGDGDFQPKFKHDYSGNASVEPIQNEHGNLLFDAG